MAELRRRGGRDQVLEHLGSAHTDVELSALLHVGQERLHPSQGMLDVQFEQGSQSAPATVQATSSRLLVEAVQRAWGKLGFTTIFDEAFFQLVLARVVEPTSVRDAGRVLSALGLQARHRNTFIHALKRCQTNEYRDHLATACFEYAATRGDVSLVLYDVTTLYFEAEHEDELRKVGFSKERRVDPQIVVGLLVDRNGFPLEVGCYEGNTAETAAIIPIVKQFQARHGLSDMVVVADAGMLSTSNLTALDEAGLRFIVGSRAVEAPGDLASHFRWHGDAFSDGRVIDTITPRRPLPLPGRRTRRPSAPNRSGTQHTFRGRGARCGPTPANGPCVTARPDSCHLMCERRSGSTFRPFLGVLAG